MYHPYLAILLTHLPPLLPHILPLFPCSKQVLEDATFGLKNKNKSAKVQKYVKQVEIAVKHSDGSAARQANNELKKASKALRVAEEAELAKLLGEGLTGGLVGKKKNAMEEKAAALGLSGAYMYIYACMCSAAEKDMSTHPHF